MASTIENKSPIRYWKPNMAALPPELGRSIIMEIMSPHTFDYSKIDAECDRVERELAKIGRGKNTKRFVDGGK